MTHTQAQIDAAKKALKEFEVPQGYIYLGENETTSEQVVRAVLTAAAQVPLDIQRTLAQIDAVKALLPGYEQYLEWAIERRVLFVAEGRKNLECAKAAIAALTTAAAQGPLDIQRTFIKEAHDRVSSAAQVDTRSASELADVLTVMERRDRNATIERCAQVLDKYDGEMAAYYAAAIRALKVDTNMTRKLPDPYANIKAATIERCAQVADSYKSDGAIQPMWSAGAIIAATIRALKDKP